MAKSSTAVTFTIIRLETILFVTLLKMYHMTSKVYLAYIFHWKLPKEWQFQILSLQGYYTTEFLFICDFYVDCSSYYHRRIWIYFLTISCPVHHESKLLYTQQNIHDQSWFVSRQKRTIPKSFSDEIVKSPSLSHQNILNICFLLWI